MKPDDPTRMRHMLDSAKEALSFVNGKSRSDLHEDRMLVLALVRCIEVIGEAAAQTSKDIQQRHAHLPWSAMVGMRNRLIHGYFDVDVDRLWDTVHQELPQLVIKLKALLSENL